MFIFIIFWLAFATWAAASAAAFAAAAASSATLGIESVFGATTFSSSKAILRIHDFNLGITDF